MVLLAWSDDESDPQRAISQEALAILEAATDAKGRKLKVIKLPCPPPLFRTQEEWDTLVRVCLFVLCEGCAFVQLARKELLFIFS